MAAMTIVLTVLAVSTLVVLGVPAPAFAAPIPDYFADEWVGFVCLAAVLPGSSATTPVLLQLNFDKVTFGGISLTWADTLFAFFTGSNLGLLSPLIGNRPAATCSLTPSQTLVQFPGATAEQAAREVSGTFQQLGFGRYVIFDVFLSGEVLYLGPVSTVRGDVFIVNGNNDLSYFGTNEIAEPFVP